MPDDKIPWPHAPEHRLCVRGTYFVTASTYLRAQRFRGKARLAVLHRGFAQGRGEIRLAAGSVGGFLEPLPLRRALTGGRGYGGELVPDARPLARKDRQVAQQVGRPPARKVWHNFRETRLTYEKSYLARLNYTHQNPVKHGLVPVANQYPWCSARWFERSATPAQSKTIYRFKTDQLNVPDDFEVSPEW